MTMRRTRAAAAVMLFALSVAPALAASGRGGSLTVGDVTAANRPASGRLTITAVGDAPFAIAHDGNHVTLRFNSNVLISGTPAAPRNVLSMTIGGSMIDMAVTDAARIQSYRSHGNVILDVLDPSPTAPKPAAPQKTRLAANRRMGGLTRPAPSVLSYSPELGGRAAYFAAANVPPSLATAPPSATPKPDAPADTSSAAATPLPVQAASPPLEPDPDIGANRPIPPGRDTLPEEPLSPTSEITARRVALPNGVAGSAFLVPFDTTAGAAVFDDGTGTSIVFDQRRVVDMTALKADADFSAVSVQPLANGSRIHVPQAAGKIVSVTPLWRGWRIALLPSPPSLQAIGIEIHDHKVNFVADEPGEVLTMTDPQSGATLLVGTQRHAGAGVLRPRRTDEFDIRPTRMGVVVEPHAAQVAMRPSLAGFQLTGGQDGLHVPESNDINDAKLDAEELTRRFDFADKPASALRNLWRQQMAEAAAAPAQARGKAHQRAAATMVSLGMGAEAASLLNLAAAEDPAVAASPDNNALAAIAALLAGRVSESDGINDHRLDGNDEIALWRGVRQAMLDQGSPAAAAIFSTTAPLAAVYPAAIRDRVLPLILETMLEGGEIDPTKHILLRRPDDPRLTYARALLRHAEGDTDGALVLLDQLSNAHDQYDRARAAVRAVEYRLAARKLDPAQAADALDKLLFTWRGDGRELALRERLAELRGRTGHWTDAFTLLRQAEADFPDQAAAIHNRLRNAFAAMVQDTATQHMRPIEFIAQVDDNADLLRDFDLANNVDQTLVDDLLALDLPQRAKPVLEKLLESAATDDAKTRFALSLARLRLHGGDPAGAIATLDANATPHSPAAEDASLLRADATAQAGDTPAAVAILTRVHTPRATEARARLLEATNDWPAAEQAWSDLAQQTIPATGSLNETQLRTVVRLATATARAKDEAALANLRQRYGVRIAGGSLGDMFRLLTAQPVLSAADLPRSRRETSMAASLPRNLNALTTEPQIH